MQRNKQVAMGRKKFNMDPKKVSGYNCYDSLKMCFVPHVLISRI